MSVTDRLTDTKAGWCTRCRADNCVLCAAPGCACPKRSHPSRPSTVRSAPSRRAASGNGSATSGNPVAETPPRSVARRGKAKLTEPVWELVKAEPPVLPEKAKRLTVVEKARPMLEDLMAAGSRDWHRIALFPSSMAAGQTKGRLAKAYREFDWKAVRLPEIGQSAIYVRWLGEKADLL